MYSWLKEKEVQGILQKVKPRDIGEEEVSVVDKVLLGQREGVTVVDKVHLNQEEVVVVERKGLLEAAEVERDEVLPDCLLVTQGEL